ncbi:AraC family transcriptional regulator [Synoicihabitans lomoniglobus]|uniref:AraC family transcriptional regulator n=1 Tax=Synoicihabitans lomoniglobus TaxID=2909285 RepID=A0AAF0CNQ4_9BACT|nr:AraC family transcriptional regulator [Opitutaceae bacterium LMO-M01]WED64715.1 AraC family transcriptional regulator [Opitutaceae bacterium LMO-M01]
MRARFEKVRVEPTRSFYIEERHLDRFDAPWHFHPEIELTSIVASRGKRFVGDCIEPFAEGDLVLLGPNLPHFWHNEGNQSSHGPAHSVVTQFRPDFLGSEILSTPEFASVQQLFRRAGRGLSFSGRSARRISDSLRSLANQTGLPALLELLAILHQLAQTRNARPLASAAYEPSLDRHAEQRLARVYAFLMRNFREQPTLAEIARVASMNPEAFSRYFKRATGRNVSVFLNELRIDQAARSLQETTGQISEIALASGFATLSSFHRRFRERMGCSPSAYRKAFAENKMPPPAAFSR